MTIQGLSKRQAAIRRLVLAVVALAACLAMTRPGMAQSPRVTGEAGNWTRVEASGLVAYSAHGEIDGDSIEIACDVAMSLDHSNTGIAVEIGGRMLPANSRVSFTVDGQTITIPSGPSGGIQAGGCPECAEKFAQLWPLLRQGSTLRITSADGSRATFALRGTAQLMPTEPCPAGS